MLKIKTPATSANIGTGFDCLGMAFNLYNTFEIEESKEDKLINVEEEFNNKDNLFLQAFHKVSDKNVNVTFSCEIPVARGLGSSASLIVAGLLAANKLEDNKLTEEDLLSLANEMEGHPDNTSACLKGGFTGCIINDDKLYVRKFALANDWKFTLFIPNFEVNTASARKILPSSYEKSVVVSSISQAIMSVKALEDGDLELLKASEKDKIHQPYRKELIHQFDDLKDIVESDSDGILLISGSGSTCILISKRYLTETAKEAISKLTSEWIIREVELANNGAVVSYE